jgi:ADP-ribose pyrophosphatase
MRTSPYRVISSKSIYQNPWISVREDKVITSSGNKGIFGVVEMKAGSTAMNEKKELYLVKEYKYGIGRESIELMSGGIDGNETPLNAAKRELEEETGLQAKEWIDLGMVDPFTTVIHSPNYMFLALGLEQRSQSLDDDEILDVVKVTFLEALEMVTRSEITHSASCVCILKAYRYLRAHNLL